MNIVNTRSLAATLDALNEAFFHGRSLTKSQREGAAKWIAGRQGMPHSYRNMFAPTDSDYRKGFKVFTGESIRSGAATGHILGEEASRALILLDVPSKGVKDSLKRASAGITNALGHHESMGGTQGMYCCGTCSVAFWRNLSVGGISGSERRLKAGMKALKSYRDGNGKWRRFPFYYTLLALSELDFPSAVAEMRYTAPVLERYLDRSAKRTKFTQRRRALAERVLEMC